MGLKRMASGSVLAPCCGPQVAIGSYPNTREGQPGAPTYKVKLSFTSRDEAALSLAVQAVQAAFPAGTFKDA